MHITSFDNCKNSISLSTSKGYPIFCPRAKHNIDVIKTSVFSLNTTGLSSIQGDKFTVYICWKSLQAAELLLPPSVYIREKGDLFIEGGRGRIRMRSRLHEPGSRQGGGAGGLQLCSQRKQEFFLTNTQSRFASIVIFKVAWELLARPVSVFVYL